MDTPLPPESLIQRFTGTVAPLLKHINQNIHESRTLAALRDALLPKLLSGELPLSVSRH
jgi:type I restriction enzyme S subunit